MVAREPFQYVVILSVAVASSAFMASSMGVSVFKTSNPDNDNLLKEDPSCENIGGFDAVGDVLGCVTNSLSDIFKLGQISTTVPEVNSIIFVPLGIGLLLILIMIIRGVA